MFSLATPLNFSADLAAPNPSNDRVRVINPSVGITGITMSAPDTAIAHTNTGWNTNCQPTGQATS